MIGSSGCRGGARASSSASTSRPCIAPILRRSASILGGHGITAWGATSGECEANSLGHHPHGAGVPRPPAAAAGALGSGRRPATSRCRTPPGGHERRRWRRSSGDWRRPTTRRSAHYTDSPVVLDFCHRANSARLAALGTSCPDHFLRTKVRPARARPRRRHSRRRRRRAAARAPSRLPRRLPALLRAACLSRLAGHAGRRSRHRARARRRHVLLRSRQADGPGRGRVLRQRHQRDAGRGVGLHLRADPGVREVPDRVLGARGGQAAPSASSPSAVDARSPS